MRVAAIRTVFATTIVSAMRRRRVAGPVLVGIAAAALSSIAIAGSARETASTVVPAQHYVAYELNQPERFFENVTLVDRYGTHSGVGVEEAEFLLVPAEKRRTGRAPEPILDPNAHLVCHGISVASFPERTATVSNQFTPNSTLTLGRPTWLCAPASKALTGTAGPPPSGLNHYLCYDVRTETPIFPSETLTTQDQFGTRNPRVDRTREFCTPVEKQRAGHPAEPIVRSDDYLACVRISTFTPAFARRNVSARDQFSLETLRVVSPRRLCVPSTSPGDNHPPTAIALSNSSVPENEPVGTTVGNFSTTDPDAGQTHTYSLVAGAGDADNASFQISGSTLQTAAVFDFETKNSYTIRVRSTDSGTPPASVEQVFVITVTDVNEAPPNQAPTDIALSNSSVAENQPSGTTVGTLSTTDPDAGDTHTYSLVAGAGDADNASFQISGSTLQTAAVFDFETDNSKSVRIRTDDGNGGTFEEQFTITVTNANDPPTDIALSNSSVDENQPVGTTVGTLSGTDQDAGDTHTFALVSGAGDTDNASFQISGSTLQTNAVFNFEVKNSFSIRVRVTDSGSGTFEEVFTITINDVNDPPTAVADAYGNAVGNTLAVLGTPGTGPHIVLTGNVLTNNDVDEDGDSFSAVAETVSSTGGGTATINSDGSFTFLPGVGDKNQVDTFTYHVTDGVDTGAGTVSVTIANVLVWYVNGAGGAGDGRSNAPFNNLMSLNGPGGAGDADTTGDIIFLYSAVYTGGLPLEASQKLTGQPHGLTVDPGSGNVTLVPAGGTNPSIGNSSGNGIGLANDVEIQRVDVLGTTGAGVTGTAITNATIGPNTSIGGASGNAFELSGPAAGTIDVGSAISSSTARSISVQNRTGGAVNLIGSVADTGLGVLLNSNTGATITLSNGMTISTGPNAGFTATGGGTVAATAATNTIATTTGTALNVANTTIGAGGLNFRSIASNGAVNGIVLNNTGNTAGLTVAGTGAAGTGGTIQNSSGAGIDLMSTRSPSFSFMNVQNGGDDGIRGSSVNGFNLSSSSVSNNGNAVNESGLDFVGGLTGTASISSTNVTGSAENNLIVTNASGTLNLTVTGGSFSNTSALVGNDGIHLDANTTAAIIASITGATFSNSRGDHFQFATNATSTGSSNVTFSNNTLTGAAGNLGAGITLSTDASSDTAFTLANNNVQGAVSSAITVDLGTNSTAGGTLSGTISGNTIGTAGVVNSGSSQFNGITTYANGNGTMTVAIANNLIREYNNFAGIDARIRAGAAPTLNATITGNTISNPGTFANNGLFVQGGAATGDGGLICAGITGNTMAGSGANGGTDFRLRQRFNTTIRLPGYGGAAGDTAAVIAFVQGNNPGAETGSATVDFPASGGGFVGGAACPTP
jgi:hypothetical protein